MTDKQKRKAKKEAQKQKLIKQQKLEQEVKEKQMEANKLYILGLKDFLDMKKRLVKLNLVETEKLQSMLMDHHKNRLFKIMSLKDIRRRLKEV